MSARVSFQALTVGVTEIIRFLDSYTVQDVFFDVSEVASFLKYRYKLIILHSIKT
jgi:hypothetical protein